MLCFPLDGVFSVFMIHIFLLSLINRYCNDPCFSVQFVARKYMRRTWRHCWVEVKIPVRIFPCCLCIALVYISRVKFKNKLSKIKGIVFDWWFAFGDVTLWMKWNYLWVKGLGIFDGVATLYNAIAKQILVKLYVTQ